VPFEKLPKLGVQPTEGRCDGHFTTSSSPPFSSATFRRSSST
jgi:hypothetical protein